MKNKDLAKNFHLHQEKDNLRYDRMKKKAEKFENIANYAAYGGIGIGIIGFVLTISIDAIRTQPPIMGWLQKTGMIVFLAIFAVSTGLLAMLKEDEGDTIPDTLMRGGSFKKMDE